MNRNGFTSPGARARIEQTAGEVRTAVVIARAADAARLAEAMRLAALEPDVPHPCACGCPRFTDPMKKQRLFASMACRGRFYGRQRSPASMRAMVAVANVSPKRHAPCGRAVGTTGLL